MPTYKVTDLRDWSTIEQGGNVRPQKRVIFYIGTFGPFTEYFDRDAYSLAELEARVNALALQLPSQA